MFDGCSSGGSIIVGDDEFNVVDIVLGGADFSSEGGRIVLDDAFNTVDVVVVGLADFFSEEDIISGDGSTPKGAIADGVIALGV
jgi:hypothetical protein